MSVEINILTQRLQYLRADCLAIFFELQASNYIICQFYILKYHLYVMCNELNMLNYYVVYDIKYNTFALCNIHVFEWILNNHRNIYGFQL